MTEGLLDRTADATLESAVNVTNNVGNNYKFTDKKKLSLGLKITHSPVFRLISVIYSCYLFSGVK